MEQDKRADLIRQKLEIDDRLSRLKTKQRDARAYAAKHRVYMDVNEYSKLDRKISDLKRESQYLQLEITKLNGQRPKVVPRWACASSTPPGDYCRRKPFRWF